MTSAALAADVPPQPMKRPRIKNVSEATRNFRLVDDEESSLTPSFMRDARWTCDYCGTRSITRNHALCEAKGRNGKR